MGYIRDFVAKIAEALVAATELPKQMADLKIGMDALNSDLERTKARNIELDTLLADTRRQRDEAEQALSQARSDLAKAETDARNAHVEVDDYHNKLRATLDDLVNARKERDDYGLKHMAAEDRANEAEGKLKKLREAMGMDEPNPTPTPPEPTPQPTIKEEAKRVYEGEYGFSDLPYANEKWDGERQLYYRTA